MMVAENKLLDALIMIIKGVFYADKAMLRITVTVSEKQEDFKMG